MPPDFAVGDRVKLTRHGAEPVRGRIDEIIPAPEGGHAAAVVMVGRKPTPVRLANLAPDEGRRRGR